TTGQYIQNLELWARTYPREPAPLIGLGTVYADTGELEKALAKFQEVGHVYPPRTAVDVIGLVVMYSSLDRFEEAKAVAAKALAREDAPMLHLQLLLIAYAQADQEAAAKQIEWFAGKPEEYNSVAAQAAEAKARGQLRRSDALLRRAAALAGDRNLPNVV